MLRKLIIWILALVLIISVLPLFAFATTESTTEPGLQSQGAFLMDMQSGKVLYAKNEHQRFYPASITKIMTAILAIEHSKMDEPVTVSKLATEQEGNRVYLVEGETQTMENMLYGLMLNSGNDAAIAIAEHVSGSVEAFADLMNQKAKELGAKDTHFVNPNGLHDPNHYTTPYDITLIAQYAMKNPKFREIVKTETLPWYGKEWESVLYNINPMLYNYEGVTGVKTGYTDQARQTMVVSAMNGNQQLIGTLMNTETKQAIRLDATALLDYGFTNFETKQYAEKDNVITSLSFGKDLQTNVKVQNNWFYTSLRSESSNLEPKINLNSQVTPPLKAGTVVGQLEFRNNGVKVGSVPLVTVQEVQAPPTLIGYVHTKFKWWYTVLPLPALLVGLIYRRMQRSRTEQDIRLQSFSD